MSAIVTTLKDLNSLFERIIGDLDLGDALIRVADNQMIEELPDYERSISTTGPQNAEVSIFSTDSKGDRQ